MGLILQEISDSAGRSEKRTPPSTRLTYQEALVMSGMLRKTNLETEEPFLFSDDLQIYLRCGSFSSKV